MATAIIRNLKATDAFLGQVKRLPSAEEIQRKRVEIITHGIAALWLDATDASSLSEAINSCENLSGDSKETLLHSVSVVLSDVLPEDCDAGHVSSRKAYSKGQDYSNLVHYIPESLKDMLSSERSPADCLLALSYHCHCLGLLRPSEKTCAIMTLLCFWHKWKDGPPSEHTKYLVNQLAKPFIRQHLVYYQRQNPVVATQQLSVLPKRVDRAPVWVRKLFGADPPSLLDQKCVMAAEAMVCRQSKLSLACVGNVAQVQQELSNLSEDVKSMFSKPSGARPLLHSPVAAKVIFSPTEIMPLQDSQQQGTKRSAVEAVEDDKGAVEQATDVAEPVSQLVAVAPCRKKSRVNVEESLLSLKASLKAKAASKVQCNSGGSSVKEAEVEQEDLSQPKPKAKAKAQAKSKAEAKSKAQPKAKAQADGEAEKKKERRGF